MHKGSPADIEKIYDLKSKYNYIKIIEDAAHAFGAKRKNKIGSFGDFVCFSFQAIKHITTGDEEHYFVEIQMIIKLQKNLNGLGSTEMKKAEMFGETI